MERFWDSLARFFKRKSRDIYDYSHIRPMREPANSEFKILNYVWINKTPFSSEHDDVMCGIPLNYIDRAIQNAKRYPDTQVRLWLDYNLLDQQSLFFVASHIHFADADNIAIHDLNEIPKYRDNAIFHPNEEGLMDSIWARVDIARVLALQYCLENTEAQQAFYSDFDVDDVKLHRKRVQSLIQKNGLVLGATTTVERPENGYFGFHRCNKDMLDDLATRSLHKHEHSRNGAYLAFCHFNNETLLGGYSIHPEDASIRILKPMGYTIPSKEIYRKLRLNL